MKMSFDTDGTKTDFYKFITSESSKKHFKSKYDMEPVNSRGVELEDVYDIENTLIKRGYSEEEAHAKMIEITKRYWVSPRFIQFSLLTRFRKGVRRTISNLKNIGHDINIDSSRAKTTDPDLVGKIAKNFTLCQYKLNGVFLSREKISFYKNDEEKLAGLEAKQPKVVFDDKPEVINKASNFTKVVCVNAPSNEGLEFNENVTRIDEFTEEEVENALKRLFGDKGYEYLTRDARSEKFYKQIKKFIIPIVLNKFDPIILNEHNVVDGNEATIYAPNHRSTLDPIIITSILDKSIHWVALKRFFTGEDSIFNNSKNHVLCKITSSTFKKLEYFPIERLSDNPKANNLTALKDMQGFLKIGGKLGIFPEGTTLKKPYTKDFGDFDDSFIRMAKRNDAWVQPITTLWMKELELPQKLIINFGEPFKVGELSVEEAMEHYIDIQNKNMEEMKELKNKLVQESLADLEKDNQTFSL